MSSHCNRYPKNCGCGSYVGTKCGLPDGDPRILELDGHMVEELKQSELDEYNRRERRGSGKAHRKHARNYTPPKKRR